jgi:hypothetical protein
MYLKNDRIIVTIKNLSFRSHRLGGMGEFVLDPTALTGWDDGVNVRRNTTPRPVSHGDFKEPYTYASRLIAVSGTAIATSRGELQQMRDALAGVLGKDEYSEIRVETAASTRFAIVGLENSVSWIQQHDTVAVFRIEFYAPESYIYGAERIVTLGASGESSGGLKYSLSYPLNYNATVVQPMSPTLSNRGNTTAWPRFKVTGDYYSGFILTDGKNNKVTYNGLVTNSAPVEIDMGKGTATQSGVDKTVLISDRNWFGILPNDTIRPEFKPILPASGWCDIIIRDTFI